MNRQLKTLAVTTLSLAVPMIASMAEARTSPPLGRAAVATQESCFVYDTTLAAGTARLGLRNSCAADRTFHMALPVDAPQAFTVLVRLRDQGGAGLSCTTRVRDAFGFTVGADDSDANTIADGDEELLITTDAVPAGGTLSLSCTFTGLVANGVKILGVDWF